MRTYFFNAILMKNLLNNINKIFKYLKSKLFSIINNTSLYF